MIQEDAPFGVDFLPSFDVQSRHSIEIAASAPEVYEATRSLDLSRSWIIRTLFRLRGMPTSALTLDGLAKSRFLPLLEQPPEGFVLGIIGQFWRPSGHLLDFEPTEFGDLQPPEYSKAIWSFGVVPLSASSCRLVTVTRVACPSPRTRRRFRLYWTLVGPFSGVVRRELLKVVKRQCERTHESGLP